MRGLDPGQPVEYRPSDIQTLMKLAHIHSFLITKGHQIIASSWRGPGSRGVGQLYLHYLVPVTGSMVPDCAC
jgi:hypothetical protein